MHEISSYVWRHRLNKVLYLYLGMMIWVHQIATIESRSLTTFRTESMRIRAPKRSADGNVFEEAFQLIKQHFIDRSKYTENDWRKLKTEYGSIPDQHEAIRRFLRTFHDPYTTFYEPITMGHKTEAFRGEKVTLGLSLGRRWDFKNLAQLRNGLKKSFTRLFSGDYSVLNEHKLTFCRYAVASLTLMPGISSRMSTQLLKYTKRLSPSLVRRFCVGAYGCMICVDAMSTIINACCDIVVTECIGGAAMSGVRIGDKVISIYYDDDDNSPCYDKKANRRHSMRSMQKVIENGPIDQYVYMNIIRPDKAVATSVKESSSSSGSNKNEENFIIKCHRDYSPVSTVSGYLLPSNVTYVRIDSFSDRSLIDVQNMLQNYPSDQGVVLDLRGNLGGTLPTALDTASLFLRNGVDIMRLVTSFGATEKNRKEQVHRSTNYRPLQVPLLILTDHRTASASEIMVAALHDNERCVVVGKRTLGKDVAQAVVTLSDGSGVALTVRVFRTPVGNLKMGDGLEPDLHLDSIGDVNLNKIRYVGYGINAGSSGCWFVDGIPVRRKRDFELKGKHVTKNRLKFGLGY